MESGILAQKEGNLSELKSKNSEERRIKALHDGCCLIEDVMKKYEDWLRGKSSRYIGPLLCNCNKAKHYAKYVFHRFYRHKDLEKFNYVDVALTCCYFVTKIQDSVLTTITNIKVFLTITQEAWMKRSNRTLEDLVYIVPRLECVLYQGIGFDLKFDIPYKYVPECFKMSLNMQPARADALVTNGYTPSDCTRYFLGYCLFSQLCVDERFDGRSIAAAAVDYALSATSLKNHKNYVPNWLEKMNSSPTAAGHKVLSASFIEEIQRERKNANHHHQSPIPPSEENKRPYSGTEENRKRSRMGSPVIESIGQVKQETTQKAPFLLSSSQPSEPAPLIPPSVIQATTEPAPLIPPSVIQTTTEPAPLIPPSVIQATTEPAPLFSMDSTTSEPQPLFPSTSAPSLQSLVRVESVDSPAPLFVSQDATREQEDAPLFSF